MEMAWCLNCREDVTLAHAVAELPCPSCGGCEYFVAIDEGGQEALFSKAERMQRIGRWAAAAEIYSSCASKGLMSAADLNLSMATLEWRRACAVAGASLIQDSGGEIPLEDFRAELQDSFEDYVVAWLLHEYQDIRTVMRDGGYVVEVA